MRVQFRGGAACAIAAAAVLAGAMAAPAPVHGSAVCPPPPDKLAALISLDADEAGPLTAAFRPVYGVYAEVAAGCWPGDAITVVGFVAGPEGLGGVAAFEIEPAWMTSRAHFLSTTDAVDPEAGPVGPFFPVAVSPGLETAFAALEGRWVRATGQFDDPVATTCTVGPTGTNTGAVPTPEEAIEICRTSFVLTAVELFALPPTDTARVVAPSIEPPGLRRRAPWTHGFHPAQVSRRS